MRMLQYVRVAAVRGDRHALFVHRHVRVPAVVPADAEPAPTVRGGPDVGVPRAVAPVHDLVQDHHAGIGGFRAEEPAGARPGGECEGEKRDRCEKSEFHVVNLFFDFEYPTTAGLAAFAADLVSPFNIIPKADMSNFSFLAR